MRPLPPADSRVDSCYLFTRGYNFLSDARTIRLQIK